MKDIVTDFHPINEITAPLIGVPNYISTGIIKALMDTGEKVSVGEIEYQEYDEENFQYIITPYWDIIDGLPSSLFQGIPGINMDLRLNHYYRVNYTPVFISERSPSKNREDLWELMESVGLDYYDRFEWLLRTSLRCGNDNLIVERKREGKVSEIFDSKILSSLQYGDRVVIEDLSKLTKSVSSYNDIIFTLVTNGIDVIDREDNVIIDKCSRSALVSIAVAQRIIKHNEYLSKRQEGIENAKKQDKYTGRKPIDVDDMLLEEVYKEFKEGHISLEEALKRTKIPSKSTFYRKIKNIKN